MTRAEIQDLWEHALRRAERECDEAYKSQPHLAQEKLEHYFFLMRACAIQAPSAKVHSLGATATISLRGFRPWTMPQLAGMCERDYSAGAAHADPPTGDGHLLRWIEATTESSQDRKGVLGRVREIFGQTATWRDSGLWTLILREMRDMPAKGPNGETAWYDEASGGGKGSYFKPAAGRNKITLVDEPAFRENNFGRRNLDIPTDHGVFSTTQRSILGALADYAKRHRGKAKGATLVFMSNGLAGTAVRYDKVEVR